MSIPKRRFIRFSLDLTAFLFKSNGEIVKSLIKQISIGGCLTSWDDDIFVGEDFRIEVELPNKNRLPLFCKALYKFEDVGIGAKFLNISKFEQELLGQLILHTLENDGLPLLVDPFAEPQNLSPSEQKSNFEKRRLEDEIMEDILSSNKTSSF